MRQAPVVALLGLGSQEIAAFSRLLPTERVRQPLCHHRRPQQQRILMFAAPAQSQSLVANLAKAVLIRVTPSALEREIVARLCVSAIIGMIIGMERRHSHRPAGVRTMSLVALGAATFTIVSAYGFSSGDPGRIAANVASGVGFLGAGTITHPKRYIKGSSDIDSDVRGLTTAAAIWITAGLGMAAGAGMFFTAIAGTVITITVLKMSNLKSVMFRRWRRWAMSLGLATPPPPPKPVRPPPRAAVAPPLLLEPHRATPQERVDAVLRLQHALPPAGAAGAIVEVSLISTGDAAWGEGRGADAAEAGGEAAATGAAAVPAVHRVNGSAAVPQQQVNGSAAAPAATAAAPAAQQPGVKQASAGRRGRGREAGGSSSRAAADQRGGGGGGSGVQSNGEGASRSGAKPAGKQQHAAARDARPNGGGDGSSVSPRAAGAHESHNDAGSSTAGATQQHSSGSAQLDGRGMSQQRREGGEKPRRGRSGSRANGAKAKSSSVSTQSQTSAATPPPPPPAAAAITAEAPASAHDPPPAEVAPAGKLMSLAVGRDQKDDAEAADEKRLQSSPQQVDA